MTEFSKKLDYLNFRSKNGKESIARIYTLEKYLNAILPSSYRQFLESVGGGYIRDSEVDCLEPTPFGKLNITQFSSCDAITRLFGSDVVPLGMIVIAHGHFGMETCLSLAGASAGSVYALDTEQRADWSDKTIESIPSLALEVRKFFELRRNGLISKSPELRHTYLVADCFEAFFNRLTPM